MYKQSLTHPKTYAGSTEEGQPFLKGKIPLSVRTRSPQYGPSPHTPVGWLTDRRSQNATLPQATYARSKSAGFTRSLSADKALCDPAPGLQARQRSEACS